VYRVDAKTGAETLVRGVEMVGTPLTTVSRIVATSDTEGVFNGFCGAESGFVPVSTVAPAVLMSEIELQRTQKAAEDLTAAANATEAERLNWKPLDRGRTVMDQLAERAMAGCLSDPVQLARIVDVSLCHGWAGLFVTAWHAAADAATATIAERLPAVREQLLQHAAPGAGDGIGLLEGDAGLALAVHVAQRDMPPISGWDRCLLVI